MGISIEEINELKKKVKESKQYLETRTEELALAIIQRDGFYDQMKNWRNAHLRRYNQAKIFQQELKEIKKQEQKLAGALMQKGLELFDSQEQVKKLEGLVQRIYEKAIKIRADSIAEMAKVVFFPTTPVKKKRPLSTYPSDYKRWPLKDFKPQQPETVCPCQIVIASKPVYSILNPGLCTPCFNTGDRRTRAHSTECATPGCDGSGTITAPVEETDNEKSISN